MMRRIGIAVVAVGWVTFMAWVAVGFVQGCGPAGGGPTTTVTTSTVSTTAQTAAQPPLPEQEAAMQTRPPRVVHCSRGHEWTIYPDGRTEPAGQFGFSIPSEDGGRVLCGQCIADAMRGIVGTVTGGPAPRKARK